MQLATAEKVKVCLLLKSNLFKLLLILFGFYFFSELSIAQTNNVGIGTTIPDNSSILDLTSTTRGFLVPRMTSAQRTAIVTPATGLIVYQTDAPSGFYFYNGAAWVKLVTGNFWLLTGNSLTDPVNNFVGTTDAQPLVIRTNNTEKVRILSGGSVGIGTIAPSQLLELSNGNLLLSNNDNTARQIMLAVPNGSGNFYTSFKAQVQAANITYTLPPVVGSAGQFLTALDGAGSLTWTMNSLPAGISGQTLRNNGTNWIANSILFNDGTNVGIGLAGAATQKLEIGGNLLLSNTGTSSELRLAEPSGSGNFYTGFKAQVQTANITYSLPPVIGSAGQVLTALDGTGSLTWSATSLPAGSSGQTLRNNGVGWIANNILFNDGTNVGIGLAGAASQKLEIGGNLLLSNTSTSSELRFAEPNGSGNFYTAFKAQVQASNVTYSLPTADGTIGQVLTTDGSGLLSWQTVTGGGSITAVGSMNTGAVFASTSASGQWLGLGAAAGRIAFYDQATDYINILNANLGIGTTTPGQKLDVYNGNIILSNNGTAGELMFAMPNGAFYTSFKAQAQTSNTTYTLPAGDGTNGQVLTTNGTGLLSWQTVSGGGSITAVGSMNTGAVFASSSASGQWLGLGVAAGRIAFDDQATDFVNILNANVGIGTATPGQKLDIYNGNIVLSNNGTAGELMFTVPNGTLYTSFKAQAQLGNITYTLPSADGTSGQVLTTDGTGILSWTTASGGSLPLGTNGQTLRYNGTTLTANSFLYNNGTQIGIGTIAPNTELHIFENTSDNIPTVLIQQNGSGNASLGYSLTGTSTSFTLGLNSNDNNNYEISKDATLTSNSTYTNANKMLRIHSEAGNAGIVDLNHQSRARIFLGSANQNIADAAWIKVNFNTKDFDEHSEFDVSSQFEFTANSEGYYQVNARTEFNISGTPSAGSYVTVAIYVNGSLHSQGVNLQVSDDAGTVTNIKNNAPNVGDLVRLVAGDKISIYVYQNTGASQDIIFGPAKTYLSIHKSS